MAVSAVFKKLGMVGGYSSYTNNFISLLNNNKVFLIKVFLNLIFQLGITYYIMTRTKQLDNIYLIPLIVALFGLVYVIASTNVPLWLKAIAFTFFSYCSGKLFTIYKKKYGEEAINIAVVGALSVFSVMFAIGATLLTFGIKLGPKVALILFIGLICLLIARIINILGPKLSSVRKLLYGFGIILFSLYSIFSTNNILRRSNYYNGDFITASMDFYLDIINLFTNILGYNNN